MKYIEPLKKKSSTADLANMQLISKHNKKVWFLLCAIESFSKYSWAIPLNNKNCTKITYKFQTLQMILDAT